MQTKRLFYAEAITFTNGEFIKIEGDRVLRFFGDFLFVADPDGESGSLHNVREISSISGLREAPPGFRWFER